MNTIPVTVADTGPTMYPSLYTASTYMQALIDTFGLEAVGDAYQRELLSRQPANYARASDPETSRRLQPGDVRRFSRESYSGRLLTAFHGRSLTGLTDAEATDLAMRDDNPSRGQWEGCRRRCSDLRLAGYIMDTGETRDGRIVWIISPRGTTAMYKLLDTGWSA